MDLLPFERIGKDDIDTVGGKGLSLGLMAGAGLPVPPGFCITSSVHRRLRNREIDPEVASQISSAYRQLGAGPVAVRSSATAEDGAVTSFAGQQETILGVEGEAAVLDAVVKCWASLDSERAKAYRQKQGVDETGLAMAVVVQRLVPSEVSGVLFTRDPLDPHGKRMLIEASWGLGESVVSGRVTPDRYHVDRESGAVLDRTISKKPTQITREGTQPVPAEKQEVACLDDRQLAELAELGRRVEAYYGDPRDVEWAWAEGRFWLLQARPITTVSASEREQVRQDEITALRARSGPRGTVWARYNLPEILPEPTPMTWAIVKRFMSGKGGFGLMYRDLGFDPDPSLDDEGIFDLVCGRPYCNLSREPLLQFRELPLGYPFAALKAEPQKAIYPQNLGFDPSRAGWKFWVFLPVVAVGTFLRIARRQARLQQLSRAFPDRFRKEVLPAFLGETQREAGQELSRIDSTGLLDRLEAWIQKTLFDFARESLKPTVFAAVAMENLRGGLERLTNAEKAKAAVGELVMGVHPDPDADLARGVQEFASGRMDRPKFLELFGHRGSQEMELAQPRWAEDPAAVDRLVSASPAHSAGVGEGSGVDATWDRIATDLKLAPAYRDSLGVEVRAMHTHLGLRETAKHHLLRGYAQIRRILLELDRRHRLGGIFFLLPEELPRLVKGEDLSVPIQQRRRRRSAALSLEVPQVLFSDDLEAIGRPVVVEGGDVLRGVPLSLGVAEGPALVLESPTTDVPDEPFVLVCPSTDPAWVPLFARAKALVMETGGVLSHGAIVAREFGLPAVAGLPDVQRRLQSGQRVRVDGSSGTVTILH